MQKIFLWPIRRGWQRYLEIRKNPSLSYELTSRHNLCLVATDGSAVLGLGDIGPEAAMPVMEGKCVLFKSFGKVDAFPLCIKTQDVDEIVRTIALISGSFGGVNLEDIGAPRCFEIEEKLKEICDIPIFHDEQHGTAIVTLAGLTNALKIVDKKIKDIKVVVSGAGRQLRRLQSFLLNAGVNNIIVCDRRERSTREEKDLQDIKKNLLFPQTLTAFKAGWVK